MEYNFEVLEDDKIQIANKIIDLHGVPQERLEQMRDRYESKCDNDDAEAADYYAAALESIDRVLAHRLDNPESLESGPTLLDIALAAEIGQSVSCPQCKKPFVKKTKSHTFCSNAKTKHGGNCKDRYWNLNRDDRKASLDQLHEHMNHG
jgi:hypothetical protein